MNGQQLIEKYYKAFNEWDMEAFFSLLTDDVVHDINNGEREIGIEKFRKFMKGMEIYAKEKVTNLVTFVNGDRGAAEFMIEGVYNVSAEGYPKAKGQKYRLPIG